MNKIFVTGGAGHTGCNFLELFLSDNSTNNAVVLVRKGTDQSFLPSGFGDRLAVLEGDLRDEGVYKLAAGCEAVMHIAHQTLCPEATQLAKKARIDRVFFVTTTGVFSTFNDLSEGYLSIEDGIRNSHLNWTILRPTMIFGSERDVNFHKLLRYLDTHALFPMFGNGESLMQPVYVKDLAMGLLLAVKKAEKTSHKEYNLPGRSPLTYNEIVAIAVKELGRKATLIHIPHSLSLGLAAIAESILGSRSPVKAEQVRRLSEDKAYSWSDAQNDFEYDPGTFAEKVALEITRLRAIGLLSEQTQ